MSSAFYVIAVCTLVSALLAMTWRNLVHCALFLVLTFAGLAGLYLCLNAAFLALTQFLIYIGAVAILILFALLLTGNVTRASLPLSIRQQSVGLALAVVIGATMVSAVLTSSLATMKGLPEKSMSVKQIGKLLLTDYIIPLEVLALLLTVALLGGVLVAMDEAKEPPSSTLEPVEKL